MNESNVFNGYFLKYLLTEDLLQQINKDFKFVENLSLIPFSAIPMHKNDFVNVVEYIGKKPSLKDVTIGTNFIFPIGLFSNSNYELKCNFTKTDRKFNLFLKNKDDVKLTRIILTESQNEIIYLLNEEIKKITRYQKAPVYLTISSPCGAGKTVLGTYLISVLKLKTFVIVNTLELGKQWEKRINEELTNVKCICSTNGARSLLNRSSTELDNIDILIFPDKHLSNESFLTFLINKYSMGIIDEQHVYNIETNIIMKRFLSITSFPYMFSLSATPRVTNSFFLGKIIETKNIVRKIDPLKFRQNAYEITYPNYGVNYSKHILTSREYNEYKKTLDMPYSLKRANILSIQKKKVLAFDVERNNVIINKIISSLKLLNNPKVLILTRFVAEIEIYYNSLKTLRNKDYLVYPIYTSTTKNKSPDGVTLNEIKDLLNNSEKFIIIATQDNVGTGIDVACLNMMHLTSLEKNESKIEQFIGRISRNNDTDVHHLFYYNLYDYPSIRFDAEVKSINSVLAREGWVIYYKPIINNKMIEK